MDAVKSVTESVTMKLYGRNDGRLALGCIALVQMAACCCLRFCSSGLCALLLRALTAIAHVLLLAGN